MGKISVLDPWRPRASRRPPEGSQSVPERPGGLQKVFKASQSVSKASRKLPKRPKCFQNAFEASHSVPERPTASQIVPDASRRHPERPKLLKYKRLWYFRGRRNRANALAQRVSCALAPRAKMKLNAHNPSSQESSSSAACPSRNPKP